MTFGPGTLACRCVGHPPVFWRGARKQRGNPGYGTYRPIFASLFSRSRSTVPFCGENSDGTGVSVGFGRYHLSPRVRLIRFSGKNPVSPATQPRSSVASIANFGWFVTLLPVKSFDWHGHQGADCVIRLAPAVIWVRDRSHLYLAAVEDPAGSPVCRRCGSPCHRQAIRGGQRSSASVRLAR
jgi:hypothetical protein